MEWRREIDHLRRHITNISQLLKQRRDEEGLSCKYAQVSAGCTEVHGGLETSACRSDITKHPPEWNVI